ncbi:MAG TPA: hypothetical protein VNM22_21095 [Candidatus Limnocylindrales bacterium]|nr:hypothetical protein [Candidatus Limnocylindrales bacterium]
MNPPYSKKKEALLGTGPEADKPDDQRSEHSGEVDDIININRADDAALLRVFKDEELVRAVKSGRPYESPEDLYRIEGINEDVFERVRDRITVENQAKSGFRSVTDIRETQELQEGSIPGFDRDKQEEITGARDRLIARGVIDEEGEVFRQLENIEPEIQEDLKVIETLPELTPVSETEEAQEEELPDGDVQKDEVKTRGSERRIIPGSEAETPEESEKPD